MHQYNGAVVYQKIEGKKKLHESEYGYYAPSILK